MSTAEPRPITWYRSPLDSKDFKALHQKSDFLGWCQTLGYLAVITATGALSIYSAYHWAWWVTLLVLFLHGTCFSFQINAVHELGHGTVFKTKALNAFFCKVFSFLGWINDELFNVSHARHHRYTLHQPDDLEVTLPIKVLMRNFFLEGFIHPKALVKDIGNAIRVAFGKFEGEWELKLFPPGSPDRRAPIAWARTMLAGHLLILTVALYMHWWMVPVVITFASFYGRAIFFLCNNTQHIGLQDDVPDFRLCCRTFTLNPVIQFLYWHMNYHTEHHMYAAVPCYRLGKLHRLIKHDLPPCPAGIVATWLEIAAIQAIQAKNPDYQHVALIPGVPREAAVA